MENNALLCVENHPYNVLSRAVYNNTMKKQYSYDQSTSLVGEIIIMHFGPSQEFEDRDLEYINFG